MLLERNAFDLIAFFSQCTDDMFSKFPYFFVTISTLCIMQEKNYRFIMTINCDSVES